MATQKIRASAEKFLVQGDDGFAVLRVRLLGGETVRAVGRLRDIPIGAECELIGRYEYHPTFGRQFQVESAQANLPMTLVGLERFLASRHFKGVGPKTAKRLVSHFGTQTLDILRERPSALTEVRGISEARAREIAQAFQGQEDVARLGAFLRSHGLSLQLAEKLAAHYGSGSSAMQMLQENPFQLMEDVHGVGFKTADELARTVGISEHAPERIAAALLHVLAQAQEDGHLYLPLEEWTQKTGRLLALPAADAAVMAGRLAARGAVVYERSGEALVVYSAHMHQVEMNVAQRLRELVRPNRAAAAAADVQEAAPGGGLNSPVGGGHDSACGEGVDSLAGGSQDTVPGGGSDLLPDDEAAGLRTSGRGMAVALTALQREAVAEIWRHPLVLLTGGPGTGKTTAICAVVEQARASGFTVVLAAPTGRAAKRLSESAGHPAATLHRLLEVGQQSGGRYGFGRNRRHRLEGDVFIVDEASMVDMPLFSHLLDALPDGARLLLVGDPEQLPAVGPGQVLRDVIDSGVAVVHELELVFRQAAQSAILLAAHAVRAGRTPAVEAAGRMDYYFIEQPDPEQAAALTVDLAAARLPAYLGVDAREGVQVLCPMRKGRCGVDRLNELLSVRLASPSSPQWQVGERVFRLWDKVMNNKNDYDRDIYNGDIGLVSGIDSGALTVRFGFDKDAREVRFAKGDCGGLAHAYAISVHKSQGSEYPCVVLPIVSEHSIMLYRQLVYTAMTRAKRLLVIVGAKSAFEAAVRKTDVSRRYSRLAERMQELAQAPKRHFI
ncbi:MAG: AAA family ATPase [Bacilli bacterium]